MPVFVVERYLPGLTADGLRAQARRERHAVAELTLAEGEVRHVRSTYLPADELCFSLFEAPSLEAVRQANGLTGLAFERISEAFEDP
jgi:hypothetical protein